MALCTMPLQVVYNQPPLMILQHVVGQLKRKQWTPSYATIMPSSWRFVNIFSKLRCMLCATITVAIISLRLWWTIGCGSVSSIDQRTCWSPSPRISSNHTMSVPSSCWDASDRWPIAFTSNGRCHYDIFHVVCSSHSLG